MPSNTTDQQITIPIGTDGADNPLAFTDMLADVETRLVLKYTNDADRTLRHTAPQEGDLTGLATENRYDVYDGAAYVSLYSRSFHTFVRATGQIRNNNTALTNVTGIVAALPTAGRFGWSAQVFYSSSTTADLKLAYTWPAGASAQWGAISIATTAAGVEGDVHDQVVNSSAATIALGGTGVGSPNLCLIEGEITMGGTAGNLQLQFAQNTLDPTDTTLRMVRMSVWREA